MKTPQLPGKYEVRSEVIINPSIAAVLNALKDFRSESGRTLVGKNTVSGTHGTRNTR